MVRTFTGGRPPRNEVDEQEDTQLSEPDDDERTPTGYATQPEHFQVPTGTRQRQPRPGNLQQERPQRSAEPARTTELEERTRVLEMAMGKILARLISDDPLIPLLNRDAQPATVVATRNSPALSNIVVPTRPRGSGKLNNEPCLSKHSEELMRKNADLERQLRDVQKSIDELKSPKSHQQTLDLDSAPLNLSITAEPYQEGFKIPHLETYDGLGDPDEHLHTYQAIMRIQNANDAMMCKVFLATLKSTARRWEIKRTATELKQVNQREGESLRDYMQRFNKATLDIDNVPDTICLSALLHGLKRGRFLDDLLENPPKTWNKVNDRSQILAQIQHWVRRPPPLLHDSPRADKSKHCDYHRVYGHNTKDCQHLKDELEFLARNGKLEGYVQKLHTQQPTQAHFVQGYDRPQRGNRKMARACYQDTFKKVQLAATPVGSKNHRPTQPRQQTMSISDIEHRPEGVEQKAELVEPVETVPLNPDVLERTVKIDTKLTEEERAELLEFFRINQDVFVWTADEMPGVPAELTIHRLSTDPTRRLVVQKCRLFGLEKQAAIDEEIQKLLQAGFIRRVEYSEWVSNPVLVKKPNGKWRMCIDFTNLNDACPKNPYPLPNVEKLVERATRHKWMSFLDASSSYHQVQLLLDDQEKTAFYAGDVIYCYVMMPVREIPRYVVSKKGIEVNPEKVQAIKQMEPPKTIKEVQRLTGRVAALHRFIASTSTVQAYGRGEFIHVLGVTEEVVSSVLLREENRNQKPICYVSKVLQGAEQNYPLAEKAAFALVCTARKLRAYFQSHQIVVYIDFPLRKILQKPELSGMLIGWSVELSEYDLKFQPRMTIKGQAVADFLVECASATVKEKAPEHPVWVLYVDGAANVEGSGARAVLLGPDGFKSEHALRFKFQTTNNAAEYEALIYGLKLASKLKVQSIQVFSDSQLVVGQVNGNCEIRDPQLARYASVVNRLKSRFASFQIDKIPRADNQRADQLSKLASSQETNPHRSTIVEVLDALSYTDFIVECQLLSTNPSSPSWTTPLINYLQSGELPEDPSAAKLTKRRAAHFTLLDNRLYKRAASMPLLRCLTPYEAEYVVREVHEGVCGTHIGGRTLARKLLRQGYYWPTMVEDAQNYVKKCPTCQFNADDIHMPGEMLSSLSSPWPFAQWGVDLLGPFVKGKGGCTYLVVAVDYFTKWIEAKPLSTTTENKIEEFLFNSILCRFGIPKRIITDNVPQFRAAALRSFCNDYGIELALTSVYTPQSNGQAESANKIVL
ncbi:hypothetical protein SLEP1_g38263 [Rubroshorea leprosula]|uniref:Uncharacterized protein n=1 Tax=Rubroshorea leprosula TaxID=152421 RepID=A0AAV5KXL8_9ROSI|nr:hypothetical protein SLEP1_g38263 [Rubroshorea leprosula]